MTRHRDPPGAGAPLAGPPAPEGLDDATDQGAEQAAHDGRIIHADAPDPALPNPLGDGASRAGPPDHPARDVAPIDPSNADRTVIVSDDAAGQGQDQGRTVLADAPGPGLSDPTLISDQPAQAAMAPVQPGTLINNNYRIAELISTGGMGEVYRAENVFTGDPVAVKVILPDLARDESVLDLFRREARVLVQLRDEAIVRYHNFVLDAGLGRYCLIMEFVEGRHLGARVKQDGALTDTGALALLRRLAAGLGRAHARGVTHRDLSPDNVILRDDRIDEAVLIDFGIARSIEFGDGLAGRFAGKFKYIAPEQLGHWGGHIGPQTDIYGLALLVASVARGAPLAMGDSVISASAARQAIPDLSGLSHHLFPLLQHMLEPDPARRPPDMATVLRIIDDPLLLSAQYRLPLWEIAPSADKPPAAPDDAQSDSPFAGLATQAPPPAPDAPPRPGHARRWRAMALLAGLGLAVLGGGAAIYRDLAGTGPPDPVTAATPPDMTRPTMPARDPSTRDGFLADHELPGCALALRVAQGRHAGMIRLLGPAGTDASGLLAGYESAFGTRPALVREVVTDAQCLALEAMRQLTGRPAPAPVLIADAVMEGASLQIQGHVSGLADRSLWLFLVSPEGLVYDLSAQGRRDGQGRHDFGIAIAAEGRDALPDAPYLLAALTTPRPLASVAAAPAAAEAGPLLALVLRELHDSAAAPALAIAAIRPPIP